MSTFILNGCVHQNESTLDYLWLNSFLTQIPIAHAPTWDTVGKPYVLLRAVKACGALFVKTKIANDYVEAGLGSAREFLLIEFVSATTIPLDWQNKELALY